MSVLEIPGPPRTWLDRLRWALRDGWTVTRREFGHIRYEPGQLVGALIFPAVMVVLFGYVFGSAIEVPGGGSYREYLIPGLFAMTAVPMLDVVRLSRSRPAIAKFAYVPPGTGMPEPNT